MSDICPHCMRPGPPSARYCTDCGATLGATLVQGRTVVAPAPVSPLPMSDRQLKTLVQQAQQTFGKSSMTVQPFPMAGASKGQREHTTSVFDTSASMGWAYDGSMTKLEAAVRANTSMILNKAQLDPKDEVALVTFQKTAQIIMEMGPLHSHKRPFVEALQGLRTGSGTDINEGLKTARNGFDWSLSGVVRRIILLTDGQGGYPLGTAEDLKSRGVVIDVIGVGDAPFNVDEKLLRKVASVVEGEVRYRFIKDQKTLVDHYTQLAGKTATMP